MTTSPRGADDLVSGQAIPESTVNENMRHVEAGACHFPVVDKDLMAPPGSCADGANYIIAATATGAWAGKEDQIATALGANAANGWRYHIPIEGFTAYAQDENQRYLFNASAWAVDTTGGSFSTASTTEQLTGTDSSKASTPDSVAALWEQGSDVASAGTVSLGDGGYFVITGTTTITDVDFATDKAGRAAWVKFAGILTLTHNASTLILPTGANITTAADDTACFISEGSDVVRCVAYNRASGAPLTGGGGGGGAVDIQSFTADGTWTKPSGAAFVKVIAIGPGGGGGGGASGDNSANRSGGGGGGGGARIAGDFLGADLAGTVAVTVPTGGPGGSGGSSSSGGNGTDRSGVAATFGSLLRARGGGAGSGGSTTGGSAGGGAPASQGVLFTGQSGGTGGTSGAGTTASNLNAEDLGGGAGGGGGAGVNTSGTTANGGQGGRPAMNASVGSGEGGAAGVAPGGNGGAGTIVAAMPGDGGGGGASATAANGGTGGKGGYGAGGGGGGGTRNGFTGGVGGAGGDGLVLVVTWF